jgi:hypothetical protein
LALRPKKILTQKSAEGKSNLNKGPFVGPTQTPRTQFLVNKACCRVSLSPGVADITDTITYHQHIAAAWPWNDDGRHPQESLWHFNSTSGIARRSRGTHCPCCSAVRPTQLKRVGNETTCLTLSPECNTTMMSVLYSAHSNSAPSLCNSTSGVSPLPPPPLRRPQRRPFCFGSDQDELG